MRPEKDDIIVVWFSCGAASAVAAKRTIDKYGDLCTIRVVNNPIAEEHKDNRRFLKDVQAWLGIEIEEATHPDYPEASCNSVWRDKKFMSSPQGAPCTKVLKKGARRHWETNNFYDWIVLGFTAEEVKRYEMFVRTERDNTLPILIEDGIYKQDCIDLLIKEGIEPPEIYKLGYPNANCIGCVKASSPTYWNHVREVHPEVFRERAELSRELGSKLVRVKGELIYLDELDPEARGHSMKTMNFDCGIFCEEYRE